MVLNEFASLCGNKSKRTARHAGLWTVPHALYRVRLPLAAKFYRQINTEFIAITRARVDDRLCV